MRLFQDFLGGELSADAAVGATTLQSDAFLAMVAVVAPDTLELVIDPDGVDYGGQEPEKVVVIAHAAGSDTVTLQAPTTLAHHAGIEWVGSPVTAAVLNYFEGRHIRTVDDPYLWTAHADNQEFDRSGEPTTLPDGWTWVNQGTATYVERHGAGVVDVPIASAQSRYLVRDLPADATWEAYFKTSGLRRATGGRIGVCLHETASGEFVNLYQYEKVTNVSVATFTAHSTFGTSLADVDPGLMSDPVTYWRIKKNSATSFDFAASPDGLCWGTVLAGYDPTAFFTPNKIGFVVTSPDGTVPVRMAAHWYRVKV